MEDPFMASVRRLIEARRRKHRGVMRLIKYDGVPFIHKKTLKFEGRRKKRFDIVHTSSIGRKPTRDEGRAHAKREFMSRSNGIKIGR